MSLVSPWECNRTRRIMKKVFVIRHGAVGDHIHASHLPRMLKEKCGFDYVAFEYNPKGHFVFGNNPFIDEHIHFNAHQAPIMNFPQSYMDKRWKIIKEDGGFDKVINLQNSIEYGYIAMEDQNEYYMSTARRRKLYGGHNYYDQTTIWAGYPEHVGTTGELFFSEQEEQQVQKIYQDRYAGKFILICNLSGSSKHKLFHNAEYTIKTFLANHPDAVCITMGDEDCRTHAEFKGERIINRAGNFGEGGMHYPFRQSMLMAKYANAVIGCESGLMVAATLLGAPTVQLMTAASIKNHGGDFKNDRSLQSPAACSPCHKGPYDYIGCPKFDHLGTKYPVCVKFSAETILTQLENIYNDYAREAKALSPSALSIV
jgi:ADP-heptose:LPS heptosyltransferase